MKALILLSLILIADGQLPAADKLSCREVVAMADIARAKTVAAVKPLRPIAGNSYRAAVVFAVRTFELTPADHRAAAEFLELIPRGTERESVWHTFGDYLCDSESDRDLTSLSQLGERLPRDLARAVLIVPERMLDYISYAYASIQDPHSDYAVQMQIVCRKRKLEFLGAVDRLPADRRNWFVEKIFDPSGCRALKLPEAD